MSMLEKITRFPTPAADPNMIDRRTGQKRRVTKKLKIAIQTLARGEAPTAKAAAAKAGLSDDYVYRALALPHVRVTRSSRSRR